MPAVSRALQGAAASAISVLAAHPLPHMAGQDFMVLPYPTGAQAGVSQGSNQLWLLPSSYMGTKGTHCTAARSRHPALPTLLPCETLGSVS